MAKKSALSAKTCCQRCTFVAGVLTLALAPFVIFVVSSRGAPQERTAGIVARYAETLSLPDGDAKTRVAVVVPFRDREPHLEAFRAHWRKFARVSPTVRHWDVYVVEQFDSEPFNRGWTFNVGYAAAVRDLAASPDLASWPKAKPVACVVVQDIDYLPEQGVDYADCRYPTQLSSEIDRYNWGVPYEQSAGGVVSMSAPHWREVNGFSNDYFGWGGEDDDFYARLNRSVWRLLVPCSDGEGRRIRRPKKGHGRFSGEKMHSFGHTKRINYPKAYAENMKLLKEMLAGSDRWKRDGLSNLHFRVVDRVVDASDANHGITYHRLKVRRGHLAYDLRRVLLGIPPGAAPCGVPGAGSWTWVQLGNPVPQTLEQLRHRAAEAFGCKDGPERRLNFLLVDLRLNAAKVADDRQPRLFYQFLRSLESPPETSGMIVADMRGLEEQELESATSALLWAPPTSFVICRAEWRTIPRYKIFEARECDQGRWFDIPNGVFTAYASPPAGRPMQRFCVAESKQHDVQRIVPGAEHCAGDEWEDLKWENERFFYAHAGCSGDKEARCLCGGTRTGETQPSVRLLPAQDCTAEGFAHSFLFEQAESKPLHPAAAALCVDVRAKGGPGHPARVCLGPQGCRGEVGDDPPAPGELECFGVWAPGFARGFEDFALCGCETGLPDAWPASTFCRGAGCCPAGWQERLRFSLPAADGQEGRGGEPDDLGSAMSSLLDNLRGGGEPVVKRRATPADLARRRRPLCVGQRRAAARTARGEVSTGQCGAPHVFRSAESCEDDDYSHELTLWTASPANVAGAPSPAAAEGPQAAGGRGGRSLALLVREDSECHGFLCPDTAALMAGLRPTKGA